MIDGIVASIKEIHRNREDLLRAEIRLTNQMKGVCRRAVGFNPYSTSDAEKKLALKLADELYDAVDRLTKEAIRQDKASKGKRGVAIILRDDLPREVVGDKVVANYVALNVLALYLARMSIRASRNAVERDMEARARLLPVYATFVEPLPGFGALGLAQVIGDAGDLLQYANPAKVWKRFGLGLVEGERQRKCLDAVKADKHGYSPQRRSRMFVLGNSLLKKQNAYRDIYLARKVYEATKAPDGTKMLWHRRAQRYAEKRLLRDLWRAWRLAAGVPNVVPFHDPELRLAA